MRSEGMRRWLLLGLVFFFVGCAVKIPHAIVPDYAKRGTRLIAVMPVGSGSADPRAAGMLRDKLVEELYFKGYPKIPPKAIDEKLAGVAAGGEIPPTRVGELLRVDAVLYARMVEGGTTRILFYAPTTVDVEFELKSARTGESLWRAKDRITQRNFGLTRKQIELKSSQVFEPAIQGVVSRALSTLPDVPVAPGS
jgi:hypothetical protein